MKEFVASYNKTRKVIEDLTKVGDNPENLVRYQMILQLRILKIS